MSQTRGLGAEARRLAEDERRSSNWKRWGPYLSERQWGTVREDYSAQGNNWTDFPHDAARSRAYRWGEDGLLGVTDRQCRLCFALALWNEKDPFLKERLYGLSGPQGNHGEDVKEEYFYLDSTPTHSYLKGLYKYPQAAFPYDRLVAENRHRGREAPEFELVDTGIFHEERYFDVFTEYAKASPDALLIRITVANRGPEAARIHVLPTLWFRNTWAWGRTGEGYWPKPRMSAEGEDAIIAEQDSLGRYRLHAQAPEGGALPERLFTENETNLERLYGVPNRARHVKDAFHDHVVHGRRDAVNPERVGTKAAFHYVLEVPAGGSVRLSLRLFPEAERPEVLFGEDFDRLFEQRIHEADEFYDARLPSTLPEEERRVARQAYAGLLWSKQFYHYAVQPWLEGDPNSPPPPASRLKGRNRDWGHLYNRDIISMPDKWEYPWYAAWDVAFHMIPFARIDPLFAKEQLVLFLREWYMHPNGQIPAYEFEFSDVNPPVHAWACWRVYKMTGTQGRRDRLFLARTFQKLLLNFTWWVNRKDVDGRNLFTGGFLGLDNIGVFDRSKPLPTGGQLHQADGTAWMAFFCTTMLSMALELAQEDPAYEDIASKFFEHFVAIVDAMNHLGGSGLWEEEDGFYYDHLWLEGHDVPMRVRSMVGLVPLFAAEVLSDRLIERLPGFSKRMRWFLENRADLAHNISYMAAPEGGEAGGYRLLAIPSRERLVRVLRRVLDPREFLSDYGVRSLSRVHAEEPFVFRVGHEAHRVGYVPGESDSGMFGGNSNWRGPVWFPLNYLLIEALERYHHFYGDSLKVECPTGSGRMMTLAEVARELSSRLCRLFLPDATGRRPCHGEDPRFAEGPDWRELVLFHEYFHGDSGRGLGATHQTGWTALVVQCLTDAHRTQG
ncbi:MGH1-like glycoside hydrolase domain-containing protein [Hyalangium rubrum]|uniref:Glucosidase n=1 Tax=Hyalangium rubrum TaxID=3103134 RepID=A0ABU5HBH8_9BACT|nr:glucosidase [Hyalangium sp. s54d21]MDY7230828.1 glucosidase [Hyalangium sp. s54d21]